MKRIIVAGLVALVVACGKDKEDPPIAYGAPADPTGSELDAAAAAEATLSGGRTYAPAAQPGAGAPGLADQLVGSLGGYAAAKTMPTEASRLLAARTVSRAIDTGGIDPACVTNPTETSVRWTGCVAESSALDPDTGAIATLRVTVDGTLAWSGGTWTWTIHETLHLTDSRDGQTTTMDARVDLGGSITVGPATVVGSTSSTVSFGISLGGRSASGAVRTTLALDLRYEADPSFCVTGGELVLEQRWTQRPAGVTAADAPNQGWRFEWTGCGQFTVAHGS